MKKYVFHCEKCNFEHIWNSVYTAEFSALGKAMNIYIGHLISTSTSLYSTMIS